MINSLIFIGETGYCVWNSPYVSNGYEAESSTSKGTTELVHAVSVIGLVTSVLKYLWDRKTDYYCL